MSNEKKLKALAEERGFALKQFASLNNGTDDTYQCHYDDAVDAVQGAEVQEADGSAWVAEYRLFSIRRLKVVTTPATTVEV